MTYEEKLKIADAYLLSQVGMYWDDLPDINSLHDAYSKEDIIELCNDRINDIL
jgi:hypothetical protein